MSINDSEPVGRGRQHSESSAHSGGRGSWLIVPLALAGMLFLLLLRPVYDVDIFWQCKLGELILASRGLILTEPFAATHLGEPLPSLAWLGQTVYAQVRLFGGWPALRNFDALVWVGGFVAIALACRRSGSPPLAVVVALGIGFMAAMPCASLRPQSFAAFSFGLLLALVRRNLPPMQTVLLATPLLVLWQNLHPSVSVAAIALAASVGAGWVRYLVGLRSAPWQLTALMLLAAAAVFATPDGFSILEVSAYNARASIALNVNEWLPPWAPANRSAGLTFAVAVGITSWLVIRYRQRVVWEELAPSVVLLGLTLTAHRFALFWGLTVVPVVARVLTDPERQRWCESQSIADAPSPPVTWLSLPVLFTLSITVAALIRPTHFHESLPLDGVVALKRTGVTGTVYCHYAWGGPLIDLGYPNWTVAFDGRFYRYSPEEWQRYAASVRGEIGPAELEAVYQPSAYFLRPGADDRLIAALRRDGNWREVHADRNCVAIIRAASR